MNVYTITIQNDMMQQFCIKAETITDALDKAKILFTESMVTGDDNGTKTQKERIKYIKPILVNPPEIKEKPPTIKELCKSMPD